LYYRTGTVCHPDLIRRRRKALEGASSRARVEPILNAGPDDCRSFSATKAAYGTDFAEHLIFPLIFLFGPG
jgi:hypothetical protein